jgi:hypothetical protein
MFRQRCSFLFAALLVPTILSPAASLGQDKLSLQVAAARVGKYEKVELTIDLGSRAYKNPDDPDEVNLTIVLTSPSGKRLAIPAFYYQPFERKQVGGDRGADWFYPSGKPAWKARFAPAEVGTYEATAVLKDRGPEARSGAVAFECVPSASQGYLRAGRQDPRFMETSEGKPFFAIGQNLAFVGEQQYVTPSRADAIFEKLAANGANYVRIWTCCEDWAMALEARKSAWSRSWDRRPPIVPAPDAKEGSAARQCVKLAGGDGTNLAVMPSHPVALRPGTRYVVSARIWPEGGAGLVIDANGRGLEPITRANGAWTEAKREFTTGANQWRLDQMSLRMAGAGTIYLDSLSLREAAGGPELLWEADPNRSLFGQYNPTDCAMLDELVQAAERRGLYLQLCFMTRDQYMKMLKSADSSEYQEAIHHAKKLIRYVVARWGYSTSVGAWEYFNEIDPGLPTDRFYDELGKYFEEIDVYRHLRTTSTWSPSPKDYRHARIDIAEPHYYLRPADKKKIPDEVTAVLERAGFVRSYTPAKPALLGEFGLADDQWRPVDDMRNDRDYVHFHNAIWATAMSGLSGTAMFWWWEDIDAKDGYRHYRPLAAFLADIPWTTARLRQASAAPSQAGVRAVGLQADDQAYVWLLNREATWADHLKSDAAPAAIRGLSLVVKDLAPGKYKVQWWDTRESRTIQEGEATSAGGSLTIAVPEFNRDVACKIRAAK